MLPGNEVHLKSLMCKCSFCVLCWLSIILWNLEFCREETAFDSQVRWPTTIRLAQVPTATLKPTLFSTLFEQSGNALTVML